MALEYGINFNTEEGRRKAEKEIKKWLGDFQGYLDKNKLDIGLGTKDNKGGGRATLVGYRKELQDLRNEYKKLTTAELASGSGNAIISKYKRLREQVGIYGGTLDQAAKAQDKLESQANKTTPTIDRQTQAFKRQSDVMVQLKSYAMNFLSVYAGIRMIKNLATITGEFEMQRVSMQAILQDAEKGSAIFERIKELAVVSPFQFKDLVSYTKQLSAFSIPYEDLYQTTKELADLSAGLGVGMDRLILAYGQVRSAAVLRGQELRQFTEAGIPLVEELRKKLSEANGELVTTGEVFEYISARKVPFAMVRDIISEMTSEGGKFYMMQEKQADTLKGKIANLADAYEIMMANIGESDGGLMKGAVDAVRSLIENYEEVGKILARLAIAYGATRIAIFVTIAAMNAEKASRMLLTSVTVAQQKAQALLNATILKNPYAAAALAVAALATGIWAASKASYTLSNEMKKVDKAIANANEEMAKERAMLDYLYSKIKTLDKGTEEYRNTKDTIISQFGKYNTNLATEMEAVDGLTTSYNALRDAMYRSFVTKGYEESLSSAVDTYGKIRTKAEGKIIKSLKEQYGEGAYAIFSDLQKYIDGGELTKEVEDVLQKFERVSISARGTAGQTEAIASNDIKDQISIIRQATQTYNDVTEQLDKTFEARNQAQQQTVSEDTRILSDWQKTVSEFVKANDAQSLAFSDEDGTVYTYIKRIRDEYADLTEKYKTYSGLVDEGSKKQAANYKQQITLAEQLAATMGFSLTESKGSTKDPNIEKNAMIKAAERLAELRAKMALEEKKYALEVEQVRVDAMEEGTAKELAQIALTKEKDLQAIEERKQAMINANLDVARAKWESEGKKGVFSGEVSLTESQESVIGSMYTAADIKEIRSKELMFENLLNQYKDYAQKVKDIEEKKQKNIKNLNEGRTGDNDELIDRAIAEVERRAKEETASLAFNEIKNSEAWRVLFSDLENYTVKTLKESLAIVEQADTSNLNPADAKAVQQGIDRLKRKIDEKNPFFALKDGWEQFIRSTEQNQPDAAMEAMSRMQKAAEELLSYYSEFQNLMGAVSGEESDASFWTNTVGDILGATASTGTGVAKLMAGDMTGIKDVIKGVTGYINVFRNIRNRKYDKEIEKQEKVVKSLEEEYKRLGKAMEDSLGSDYMKNATKQSENLKNQVSAINKQIEAEKKKGKDADEKKIADLEQQRQDLMLQSAQVVEDAIEKLTGTNLTSAAEDFAKAWMDAYVSFGNTTEAMQKRFGDMMQNMIINAMLSSIMQRWLKSTFDMIDRMWADGVATPNEIAAVWREGKKAVEGANSEAEATMEILKSLGLNLQNTESNLTGISKGVASITEDTALILGGYLDSIRFKLFQYIDFMMLPENRPTMSLLIQSQATMINHLQAIELNTNAISVSNAGILDNINKVMVSTSDGWKLNVNA